MIYERIQLLSVQLYNTYFTRKGNNIMKTLQELYKEIIVNEELKAAFLEAAKNGKTLEYLRKQGCETTAEELKTMLSAKGSGEVSDEELDSVAGGGCGDPVLYEAAISVTSFGLGCATRAIMSAATGYVGQEKEGDGNLCN